MSTIPIELKAKIQKGSPHPMGATITKRGINFAIAVPKKSKCSILFYKKKEYTPFGRISLSSEVCVGNVFAVLLEEKEFQNYDYNFEIDGKVVQDSYAKQIVGREKWGGVRENEKIKCRYNKSEFDWKEDKPLENPYHKCVLYSLHPRGFTKHNSSKVQKKGTFQGILEKIPYLKNLGINVIELMPAYEFDEIVFEETPAYRVERTLKEDSTYKINYWGYGYGNYFAPKSAYCSTDNPIDEFKDFVKELHKNGIEIIMEMYFCEKINPNLIIDSLRYWYLEYHIDGFHIYGNSVPAQVILLDPILSNTKLILPHVDYPIQDQSMEPLWKNVGECNEDFAYASKRFLKSDEGQLENFSYRVRRNPKEKGIINYITSHNGFTLLDLVSYDLKHNELNNENNKDGNDYNFSWNCGVEGVSRKKSVTSLRLSQRKNAMLMLLLSQGVPYILAGDEIGNTQKGNNNAYCQDNEIGWLNWKGEEKDTQMLNFVQKLIAFRRRHPVFHQSEELKIMDYQSCGYPDISYHGTKAWHPDMSPYKRQLGIMYCGNYVKREDGKEDNFFYIAYNLYWAHQQFDLPKLPNRMKWYIAVDSSQAREDGIFKEGEEPILEQQKVLNVTPRTIVVLIGK